MTAYERIEYHGLKFDCRPGTSDEKSIKEVVLRRGYTRRYFPLPTEGLWIDLGANIGAYSVWAASQGAHVEAYEPDPESCEMIEHNLKLNKLRRHVDLTQAAVVADKRKSATLHQNVARGNVWRNSIEREWRGETSITVPCVPIKAVWSADAAIKMDVEGTEMAIMEGIGAKIAVRALTFEWSFDIDNSLDRFAAVVDRLKQMYTNVENASVPEAPDATKKSFGTWAQQWFPACRTIWAWN